MFLQQVHCSLEFLSWAKQWTDFATYSCVLSYKVSCQENWLLLSVCLLLCTYHKRLECIVSLIFICLTLPSSLVQLCRRVTICQLIHMRCVSCSAEHTCHLVVGPHTNVWCSCSLLWCLFKSNKIKKLTPVIYSANIGCETIFTVWCVCVCVCVCVWWQQLCSLYHLPPGNEKLLKLCDSFLLNLAW